MSDEEAPLDLDLLNTIDPLKLSKQDLNRLIQQQRGYRAQREAGKGRKAQMASNAPKPKGIAELLASKKPTVAVKRRGF